MIYYEKVGQGFPVIMLHGFPNDHTTWNSISPQLSKRYQLIMPDLPGAGQSDFLSDEMTVEDMAFEVNKVFEKEKIEKAIIVGHSMGGYTALNFAKHFPEKVVSLSLVHSSAYDDNEEKKQNRAKGIALIRKGDLEKKAFLKGMAYNLAGTLYKQEHPEFQETIVNNGLSITTEALISFYKAIQNRHNRTDVLSKATFPVQWIIGTEDKASTMEDMLAQSHIAKINDVVVYEDCGHMSMFESPEKLISDLIRFFDFVTPA